MFNDPKHKKYAQFLGLGAEIAVALSAPIFIGYWLDLRWETSPWMLLTGIFVGIILLIAIFSKVIKDTGNLKNRE